MNHEQPRFSDEYDDGDEDDDKEDQIQTKGSTNISGFRIFARLEPANLEHTALSSQASLLNSSFVQHNKSKSSEERVKSLSWLKAREHCCFCYSCCWPLTQKKCVRLIWLPTSLESLFLFLFSLFPLILSTLPLLFARSSQSSS